MSSSTEASSAAAPPPSAAAPATAPAAPATSAAAADSSSKDHANGGSQKPPKQQQQQQQQTAGGDQPASGGGGGGGGGHHRSGRGNRGGRSGGSGGGKGRRGQANKERGGDQQQQQHQQQSQEDAGSSSVSSEKRNKRPDVQHYRPGAFKGKQDGAGSSPSPPKEDGNDQQQQQQQGKPQQQGGGRREKGRGGKGRNKGTANDVDRLPKKMDDLSLADSKDDSSSGQPAPTSAAASGHQGNKNARRKKPEQARYVAKKSGEEQPTEGAPAAQPSAKDEHSEAKDEPPVTSSQQQQQQTTKKNKRNKNRKKPSGGSPGDMPPSQPDQDSISEPKSQPSSLQQQPSAQQQQQQAPKPSKENHTSKRDRGSTNSGGKGQAEHPGRSNGHSAGAALDHHHLQQQVVEPASGGNNNQRGKDNHRGKGDKSSNAPYDESIPPRLRDRKEQHDSTSSQRAAGAGKREQARRGGKDVCDRAASPPPHHSPRRNDRRSYSPSLRDPHQKRQQQQHHRHPQHHSPSRSKSGGGGYHGGRGRADDQSPSDLEQRLAYPQHSRSQQQHQPRGGEPEWGRRYFRDGRDGDYNSASHYDSGAHYRDRNMDHYGSRGSRGDHYRGGKSGGRYSRGSGRESELPPRFQRQRENLNRAAAAAAVYDDMHYQDGTSRYRPSDKGAMLPPQQVSDESYYRSGGRKRNDTDRSWREDSVTSSNSGYMTSSAPRREDNYYNSGSRGGSDHPPVPVREDKLALDSMPKPSSSSEKILDWVAEVEEEEEKERQRSRRAELKTSSLQAPHKNTGGLIRIPADREAPWSTTSTANNDSIDNNPAWRGMQPEQQRQWQQHDLRPRNPGGRTLFDPKNPHKHLPGGGQAVRGPEPFTRFAIEPRFQQCPRPPAFSNQKMASASGGASTGSGWPAMHHQLQQQQPEWYDISNTRIYDPNRQLHDVNLVSFIARNDTSLKQIMHSGGSGAEYKALCQYWDTSVAECRKNILQSFERLLKTDLVFCAEFDIDQHIWNVGFHDLVIRLRDALKNKKSLPLEDVDAIRCNLSSLINEGLDFYTHILDTLDDTYRMDLDSFFDVLEPRPEDKRTKFALISAQKCLLNLGDLARYKEEVEETSNFGRARQYYQQASNIEPRNGKPFNQLAILAVSTKRKFEAVYYNMRCLQSKNPFSSSQQSLTTIFSDVKKKWESQNQKRIEESQRSVRNINKPKQQHLRKEIWIRPDGGSRLHRTTSAEENPSTSPVLDPEELDLEQMATSDINRRFINSFLYLIGKLFMNIDMDTFTPALELLQKEFRVLLSRVPLACDSKRLVQIMALNMFVIERAKNSSDGESRGGRHRHQQQPQRQQSRTSQQNAALHLAFALFEILVARCNEMLANFNPYIDSSSKCLFEDEDLPSLLSAVKVWCYWLIANNDTWYPAVIVQPFTELAKLATGLEQLKPLLQPITKQFLDESSWANRSKQEKSSYELIKLCEDAQLLGFTPWLQDFDYNVHRSYCPCAIPTALTQDAKRLDAINFCIDYLEGLETPVLKWSKLDMAHLSLLTSAAANGNAPSASSGELRSSQMMDVLDESYSEDEDVPSSQQHLPSSVDNKTRQLKMRKDELQRTRAEEERESRRMRKKMLEERIHVMLEICPRFLVPDTNCFVDHLGEIRRLAKSGHYQLRIPVIVLNELDGLAKGMRDQDVDKRSADHCSKVAENSRLALSYLRNERPSCMKFITSKGSVLSSMNITTEEDSTKSHKNNDDLILDACLSCCTTIEAAGAGRRGGAGDAAAAKGLRVVQRSAVLLTDDRNLRLKAHVMEMPVNTIESFVKWAFEGSARQ